MKSTACAGQSAPVETRVIHRSDVPWSRLVPVLGVLALTGWLFGASRAPAQSPTRADQARPATEPSDSIAAIERLDAARSAALPELERPGSLPTRGALRGAGPSTAQPTSVDLGAPLSQLSASCERCHRFPHGLSHPIGVVSAVTPTAYPLDGGRVTCLTCHDERAMRPHDRGKTLVLSDSDPLVDAPRAAPARPGKSLGDGSIRVVPSSSQPNAAFLRGESVDALCAACHQASGSGVRAKPRAQSGMGQIARRPDPALHGVHAMGLLRAHLAPSTTRRHGPGGSMERMVRLTSTALGVDEESASCLSCHDGTVASDVGGHSERRSGESSSRTTVIRAVEMQGSNSHPIGVPFRSSGGPHGIELKSAASLDPRIRLFDQRVGCGSCHSMYSGEAKYQVFSNERSALCLSCHRM